MSAPETGRNLPPLPTPFDWDRGFWEAAHEHRLVVQRCGDCKLVRNFPRIMCPSCRSLSFEWIEASGRGTIYSWSTLHKAFHPAFTDLPITILIVELDDHPQVHLVGQLVGDVPETGPQIGQPVTVVYRDITDEITLPGFRLAG